VDTTKTITHIGLCAGYGGIELGLARVLPNLRSVALCEIEAFAIANLVAKMEAGLMDPAPIWTDLKTFPWAEFRDRVDILSGGYPCQPFSAAGKRVGADDPRHLWPFIASGIQVVRPKLCFFENVDGHISLGLKEVIADLESLGYETAWGIFSAAECGAPHQRRRVFLLANSMCERGQLPVEREQSAEQMSGGESEAWRAWRTWSVKPTVCGGNDGSANRVDRLRLLGNGVVPATAELAFKILLNELH
jgi:DNA (cytosine-5)-methyltransferase 1